MYRRWLWFALVIAAILAGGVRAETIGYWRFQKGDFLADNGPGQLALTPDKGAARAVASSEVDFPEKLPNTGDKNQQAVRLGSEASLSGANRPKQFHVERFTIEMYVRPEKEMGGALASHWATTAGARGSAERRWRLDLTDNGQLRMVLSQDGSRGNRTTRSQDSGLTLKPGQSYFVAAAVQVGNGSKVTFYLKNLSKGGELVSKTVRDSRVKRLHPTTAPFVVGAEARGEGYHPRRVNHFNGVIDEVRWTAGVLEKEELLGVPKPPPPPIGEQTVSYWRFEGEEEEFLQDLGSHGLTLKNENGVRQVKLDAYSPFAPGLDFSNPIPQVGVKNRFGAYFAEAQSLSHEPHDAFKHLETFTVEAYINAGVSEHRQTIIGQHGAGLLKFPERRWNFAVSGENKLTLTLSHDGSRGNRSNRTLESEIKVKPNQDYFVAVVVDVKDDGTKARFYAQNLTGNGPMQKDTNTDKNITELHVSKAPLIIGAHTSNGRDTRRAFFKGLIDEIRLSEGKLGPDQFLITEKESAE